MPETLPLIVLRLEREGSIWSETSTGRSCRTVESFAAWGESCCRNGHADSYSVAFTDVDRSRYDVRSVGCHVPEEFWED